MSQASRGYLIALIGTFFWSSTGIFIRYLTETFAMPAILLAFWRDGLVTLALVTVFLFFKRDLLWPHTQYLLFFLLYGLILAVFNSIWTISVDLNGAAVATVLAYGSAGFTALLAWWIFKEKMSVAKALAVTSSLCGCVLVAGAYHLDLWLANPLGIGTGLISGLLFAVYSLMGKETARRGLNSWHSLFYSFGFAAFFLLFFNLIPVTFPGKEIHGSIIPTLTLQGWLALIILAWVPTIGGFGLYMKSMQMLPASIANLIATLEPAMTATLAYIILGERFSLIQCIGGVMIVGAVVIVRISERNEKTIGEQNLIG